MTYDCQHRNFRFSITAIERAKRGDAVRFLTEREFARYFAVPVEYLLLDWIK